MAEHGPVAVVDVGTNTVLMVVGRQGAEGVEVLDDVHAVGRLGQGVDRRRRIHPEALGRVCAILRRYAQRARDLGVVRLQACGTSALRDAANRDEVCAAVEEASGFPLAVISGTEEARLTFAGAGFGLTLPARYAVLDIGGGSTEFALGCVERLEHQASLNVGAVRLTERCFRGLPPTAAEAIAAEAAVDEALEEVAPPPREVPLVGVAGTITTLGALDRNVTDFNAAQLNGYLLPAPRVSLLTDRLLRLDHQEIRAIPQVNDQRADVITAGAVILRHILRRWERTEITVSTRGIRYGLLLRELGLLHAV